MKMTSQQFEMFVHFTLSDSVELVSNIGYDSYIRLLNDALSKKKETAPLTEEQRERNRQLLEEWNL
jgi:hypothetical protein